MSEERMSPIQLGTICCDIIKRLHNNITRESEMLLEQLFERLIKEDKEKKDGR